MGYVHDFANNKDVMGSKLGQYGGFDNFELFPYDRGDLRTGAGSGPAAPDLVSIVAAVTPAAAGTQTTHTIAAQPKTSMNLQIRIVDGSSNVDGLYWRVTGYDLFNNYIDEEGTTWTPGTQTIATVGAFHHGVKVYSKLLGASTTGGVTFGVGRGTKLQIPTLGALADLLCKTVESTVEAGTSQITLRNKHGQTLWTPDTATDGSNNYFVSCYPTIGKPGVGV